jgi:hypothetical protein
MRDLLERRILTGADGMEALRVLKRRLSDVVWRPMPADQSVQSRLMVDESVSVDL